MSQSIDLRRLPDMHAAPPFGFEEFERRAASAARRRRATVWSSAASIGTLGVVGLLALMTQVEEPAAVVFSGPPPVEAAVAGDVPYEPAVVDVGRFEVTSDLQDHIALLDAQISAARIYAAPPERLRQMESTRAQLNESLQRVSYAQALLSF
jgi:hypothetical protein